MVEFHRELICCNRTTTGIDRFDADHDRPGCKVCGSKLSNLQLQRAISAADRAADSTTTTATAHYPPAANINQLQEAINGAADGRLPEDTAEPAPAPPPPPLGPRAVYDHTSEERQEMEDLLRWVEAKTQVRSRPQPQRNRP